MKRDSFDMQPWVAELLSLYLPLAFMLLCIYSASSLLSLFLPEIAWFIVLCTTLFLVGDAGIYLVLIVVQWLEAVRKQAEKRRTIRTRFNVDFIFEQSAYRKDNR